MIEVKFTPSVLSLYSTCLCKQHMAVLVMKAFKYMLRYRTEILSWIGDKKQGKTYKKRH